jgi:hypothetical protein
MLQIDLLHFILQHGKMQQACCKMAFNPQNCNMNFGANCYLNGVFFEDYRANAPLNFALHQKKKFSPRGVALPS